MVDGFEVTGLNELIVDLDRAQSRLIPGVRAVVERGALNIKRDWAQRWAGMKHAPALPAAISYDAYYLPGSVNAEIGPDKSRRQGALGNLVEYGSLNNAPRPGGLPALEAEAPRTEKAIGDLGQKVLEP